jgi:hypothetical protein
MTLCNKITIYPSTENSETIVSKKFNQVNKTLINNHETSNEDVKQSLKEPHQLDKLHYTNFKNSSFTSNKNYISSHTLIHKNFTSLNSDAVEIEKLPSKTFTKSENHLLCDQHCYKISQIYGCYCDLKCIRYRDCCELYLPECVTFFNEQIFGF